MRINAYKYVLATAGRKPRRGDRAVVLQADPDLARVRTEEIVAAAAPIEAVPGGLASLTAVEESGATVRSGVPRRTPGPVCAGAAKWWPDVLSRSSATARGANVGPTVVAMGGAWIAGPPFSRSNAML
jgi:hypothetical protein